MSLVAVWRMPPRVRGVNIITAGIDAFCRTNGFSTEDSRRMQVCVEGVFSYCVHNIRGAEQRNEIVVSLSWKEHDLVVIIEHCGPGGEWDAALALDASIKRKSFDAMGLFIARELLESLTHQRYYDIPSGSTQNIYTLTYRMEWKKS